MFVLDPHFDLFHNLVANAPDQVAVTQAAVFALFSVVRLIGHPTESLVLFSHLDTIDFSTQASMSS